MWQILQGDVREQLNNIDAKSIQTCVTSPPYWGLRDYGADGQLGLEPTPEEYVANMVEVFRGVKRVIRDDGTVWLNLGDSYNGSGGAGGDYAKGGLKEGQPKYPGRNINTLKPKDLVGIPWLVAFALRADGWYFRSDIIWHKPNPMPESVTDRPTKSHEYIFLLSKSQKYFYDAEAVKEPVKELWGTRNRENGKYHNEGTGLQPHGGLEKEYANRNKRSVWTVSTQPYLGAHFATFPPKLIEPCILAGTSPKACECCGSPWVRVVERNILEPLKDRPYQNEGQLRSNQTKAGHGTHGSSLGGQQHKIQQTTTGWQPTCTCKNEGTGRCKVLDPFAGSGTTLWVAEQNGRDSVGIELNAEYIELINKRMDNMQVNIFMGEGSGCFHQ